MTVAIWALKNERDLVVISRDRDAYFSFMTLVALVLGSQFKHSHSFNQSICHWITIHFIIITIMNLFLSQVQRYITINIDIGRSIVSPIRNSCLYKWHQQVSLPEPTCASSTHHAPWLCHLDITTCHRLCHLPSTTIFIYLIISVYLNLFINSWIYNPQLKIVSVC